MHESNPNLISDNTAVVESIIETENIDNSNVSFKKLTEYEETTGVYYAELKANEAATELTNVTLTMLQRFGLSIGHNETDDTSSYFIDEKSSIDDKQVEVYDQLLEINQQPAEEFILQANTVLSIDKINLKLAKNIQLKISLLKDKWRQILNANNYLYDDYVSCGLLFKIIYSQLAFNLFE